MRFHLLALPNVQTTKEYDLCGFCMATIRFAQLLNKLGHEVILYASEQNEAPCDELVTVITKEEIESLFSLTDAKYQYAYIEPWNPLWQLANARIIKEIRKRKQPRDIILTIGGGSQEVVAKAHPDLFTVEYSIGYRGSFSKFRVFESHVWRHWTYAAQQIEDGRFYDEVIPCSFDPSEFRFESKKEPFVLYVGRLIHRKGIQIACQAAEAAGVPLMLIGHGDPSLITYGKYLGALSNAERNEWMSRAQAVICPTTYIEPFCCVAAEAQLCGTPVISTDFGGFVETVEQGKTGFRCTYLGEFVKAIADCEHLDHSYIRERAINNYSIDAVAVKYDRYFKRLEMLWDEGWNTVEACDKQLVEA